MLTSMRAVIIDPSPTFLEERRRLGHDRKDEVWDGVLHMVPPASSRHQALDRDLLLLLVPLGKRHDLEVLSDTGLFARDDEYRVPDLLVFDPKFMTKRGIDGRAEIAIEILSPNDESREKFGFYAKCNVSEFWLIDPITRAFEIYVLRAGTYFAVADEAGVVRAPLLDLRLSVVMGPKLRIEWADGFAEI
jgi:Uma2 family endonuclease